MKILDIVKDDQRNEWAVIKTKRGVITFTLNADRTIHVLDSDGSALQDSEREYFDDITADERSELSAISENISNNLRWWRS